MRPRAGPDGCRKSRPPRGFDPRTVHPVASRCTDCAMPTSYLQNVILIYFRKISFLKIFEQLLKIVINDTGFKFDAEVASVRHNIPLTLHFIT